MATRKENPVRERTEEEYKVMAEKARAYRQTEAGIAARKRHAERVRCFRLTLHEETDADILAAIDPEKPVAGQLKEWIRDAIRIRAALER